MAFSWSRARRQGGRFAVGLIAGLTALWAPIEPLSAITALPKWVFTYALPAAVLFYAIRRSFSRKKLKLHGPNGLRVEIVFGDLFEQRDCNLAIGADDFFYTRSGKFVTPRSMISLLHGRRYANLSEAEFDELVHTAAHDSPAEHVEYKAAGLPAIMRSRTCRFPVGTTAVLAGNDEHHFIVALCKIALNESPPTGRASAGDLLQALMGLWSSIRSHPKGKTIAVPLLGAGMTGTGLRATEVLRFMVSSLACAARTAPLPDPVRIVIHPSHSDDVVLDDDVLEELLRP